MYVYYVTTIILILFLEEDFLEDSTDRPHSWRCAWAPARSSSCSPGGSTRRCAISWRRRTRPRRTVAGSPRPRPRRAAPRPCWPPTSTCHIPDCNCNNILFLNKFERYTIFYSFMVHKSRRKIVPCVSICHYYLFILKFYCFIIRLLEN